MPITPPNYITEENFHKALRRHKNKVLDRDSFTMEELRKAHMDFINQLVQDSYNLGVFDGRNNLD